MILSLKLICVIVPFACVMEIAFGQTKDDSPIRLEVYYETLCKYSKKFIVEQLYPTYQELGDIIDLELVPYGNAVTKVYPNGTWLFVCQHKERECAGNLFQTCAINILKDPRETLKLVYCMEKDERPDGAGKKCCDELGFDYDRIQQCTNNKEGNDWQREMAVKTNKLRPKKTYVPWLVFDGEHTEDLNNAGRSELLKVICDRYGGEKPKACNNV